MIALWWLFPAASVAADDIAVDEPDFDSALDQARFFLSEGRFAEAQEQLEVAARTPLGSQDAETWFMLAKVHYERGQLVEAEAAAAEARLQSRTPSEFSQTQELYGFFRDRFGTLVLNGPRGSRSLVELELTSALLDPELKAYVRKWRAQLAEDEVALPFSLGVPVGAYLVNGRELDVRPGESTVVDGALRSRSGLSATTFAVAAGATGWTSGSTVPTGIHGELSVMVPWRGWVGGVVGQVLVERFTDELVSPNPLIAVGGSAGLRAGRRIRVGYPWVLVPTVDLRVGQLPGVQVGCANGACAPVAPGPQTFFRVPATGLITGAALRASYERSPHWAVGFALAGEGFIGGLGGQVDGNVVNGGFSAFGWRLQTSVGYRL